jgi:FKBP-type peptidyl-prolyl cis-trans isomerase FkpA
VKKWFVCLAVALLAAGCNSDDGGGSPTDPSQVNIQFSTSDLVVGTGDEATPGKIATFNNWELWLYNPAGTASKGTRVQGSSDVGAISYTVGSTQLISGFDQGVRGMRVGGKRRIYVPSSLAYGSTGDRSGVIPPNAAIVFEVELTNIQ